VVNSYRDMVADPPARFSGSADLNAYVQSLICDWTACDYNTAPRMAIGLAQKLVTFSPSLAALATSKIVACFKTHCDHRSLDAFESELAFTILTNLKEDTL
jgi:hypothetical protein